VRPLVLLAILILASACSGDTSTNRQAAAEQPCIEEWPGPWTAECSARWVARLVDKAGYRVVGDTKSAWIATGEGTSFYIWATDHTTPVKQIARRESYRMVARIAGTTVYDDGTRKFWRANRYLIWIQAGPRDDSVAPTPPELARLIAASRSDAASP
jgi:hypothetical protein